MKYENLKNVLFISNNIKSWQRDIDMLNEPGVSVEISCGRGRFAIIGCDENSTHEYLPQTKLMIDEIRKVLQHKIDDAHKQLSEL